MANKPKLTSPAEFIHLHKKKNQPKVKAKIHGTDITKDDIVTVIRSEGTTPTVWKGKIHKDKHSDGSYKTEDLEVYSEQVNEKRKDKEDELGGGTEDVSVTVTNPNTGTSNSMTTQNVPVVVP